MAEEKLKYVIEFDVKTGVSQIKGLNNEVIATANSAKQLTAEIKNLQGGADGKGGMQGLTAATGGAAAAALELGRVVSDAPYGIRGMANNVSQLASNILFMSQQTDKATGKTIGFRGALRGIKTALGGPLGVLLLVQAVVAALDFFAGGVKKAEDGTKDLNKELKNQIDIFRLYDEQLKNNNLSLEERLETLNAISKLDKDLAKSLKAAGDDVEKQKNVLEDFLKQKEVELKLKEQEIILLDAIAKAKEADKKSVEEANEAVKETINIAGPLTQISYNRSVADNKLTNASKNYKEAQENLNKQLKIYTDLLNQLKKESPDGGGSGRVRQFQQNLLDLEKQIIGFNKSRLLAEAQGEAESRRIRQKFEEEELQRVKDAYIRKEKLRLDNYLRQQDAIINNENSTTAQIEQAEQNRLNAIATFNGQKLQAQEQYNQASKALSNKHNAENAAADAALRDQQRLHDIEMQNIQAQMDAWVTENDIIVQRDLFNANQAKLAEEKRYWEDKRDAAEEGSKEYLDAVKKARNLELQITNNAAEREKTIEQAKFEFKVGIMAATSSALGALSVLAKDGSELAKTLALTQIGIDTAIGFMSGLRIAQQTAIGKGPFAAYAMPLFYAQQVAAVLAAAAQAKRILSSGGSGSATKPSSAGGGGGTTFNPNFNVVGASSENQLASTVAGQLGEPTRAYVVYDDLRTAGEIEANAVTAAGI
jgi:hypothetical protein